MLTIVALWWKSGNQIVKYIYFFVLFSVSFNNKKSDSNSIYFCLHMTYIWIPSLDSLDYCPYLPLPLGTQLFRIYWTTIFLQQIWLRRFSVCFEMAEHFRKVACRSKTLKSIKNNIKGKLQHRVWKQKTINPRTEWVVDLSRLQQPIY